MSTAPGQDEESLFEFYRYTPSITMCIVSICFFVLISLLHCWQLFKSRNWIAVLLVLGGLLEVQSYATRPFSAREIPNVTLPLYIGQAAGALLAPALFAAVIYVSFGRIITSVSGEKFVWLPVKWFTGFFVAGDLTGLIIQSAGASLMPRGTYQDYLVGANVVIGGLALLTFYISLFVVTAAIFHFRVRKSSTHHFPQLSASALAPSSNIIHRLTNPVPSLSWETNLIILYATSTLILIRSIYRLVEYSGGNNSWLMRNEWTLYVFDTFLMWIFLVVFAIWPVVGRNTAHSNDLEQGAVNGKKSWFRIRSNGKQEGRLKDESLESREKGDSRLGKGGEASDRKIV